MTLSATYLELGLHHQQGFGHGPLDRASSPEEAKTTGLGGRTVPLYLYWQGRCFGNGSKALRKFPDVALRPCGATNRHNGQESLERQPGPRQMAERLAVPGHLEEIAISALPEESRWRRLGRREVDYRLRANRYIRMASAAAHGKVKS